jgi:hypothetical protein
MNRRKFIMLAGACVVEELVVHPGNSHPMAVGAAPALPISATSSTRWLRAYEGKPSSTLNDDPRFLSLLADTISTPSEGIMSAASLLARIKLYTGIPNSIWISRGRYLVASGCMAHCGFNRILFWIDISASQGKKSPGSPLVLVTFREVDGPSTKLTFIANDDLKAQGGEVPIDFQSNLAKWLGARRQGSRLPGGRVNALEIRSPGSMSLALGPRDIGLPARRCAPNLLTEMTA